MFNLNQPYGLYHADTNVRAFCDSERVDLVWMLLRICGAKKASSPPHAEDYTEAHKAGFPQRNRPGFPFKRRTPYEHLKK